MTNEQKKLLKQKNLEFLDADFEELEKDKIQARQKIPTLNPKVAQGLANQTLMAQKWQLSPKQSLWVDSYPEIEPEGNSLLKKFIQ